VYQEENFDKADSQVTTMSSLDHQQQQQQPSQQPSIKNMQELAQSSLTGCHNIKLKLAHSTAMLSSSKDNQVTIETQEAIGIAPKQQRQRISKEAHSVKVKTNAPNTMNSSDTSPMFQLSNAVITTRTSTSSKTITMTQLLARIWILAVMVVPQVTATAKRRTGTSDYMPEVVSPYDADHRALLEAPPSHICIEGKRHKHFPNNDKRQCHPLLAGYSRDLDTGSVCVELVSDPPQLKVTFETSGDWALVRTKFWAGASIEHVPTIAGTTEIDLDEFDFYYSNYTGYKRWIATAALTERCDGSKSSKEGDHSNSDNGDDDKNYFRVSMVAHAEVEQVDAYAHMIPGTQQVAYAYDNTVDSENEWYGWFDFKVSTKIRQYLLVIHSESTRFLFQHSSHPILEPILSLSGELSMRR
jgi:hypothetical protein